MKSKRYFIAAAAALIIGGCIITAQEVRNHPKDPLFDAMVESLTDNEGGKCTGPKKQNIWGNIFCHSENTVPCSDTYGCNS